MMFFSSTEGNLICWWLSGFFGGLQTPLRRVAEGSIYHVI